MPGPYAVRVRTADGWQDIALQGRSVAVFEQASEPMTAVNGDIWIDTDAPTPAPLVTRTFQVGRTWSITGPLSAATFPGYFVSLAPSQTGKIVAAVCKIISGTSIRAQVTKNGTNVGPSIFINTTGYYADFSPDVSIIDGDDIGLVLSSPIGSPVGLQLTVHEEHTA